MHCDIPLDNLQIKNCDSGYYNFEHFHLDWIEQMIFWIDSSYY